MREDSRLGSEAVLHQGTPCNLVTFRSLVGPADLLRTTVVTRLARQAEAWRRTLDLLKIYAVDAPMANPADWSGGKQQLSDQTGNFRFVLIQSQRLVTRFPECRLGNSLPVSSWRTNSVLNCEGIGAVARRLARTAASKCDMCRRLAALESLIALLHRREGRLDASTPRLADVPHIVPSRTDLFGVFEVHPSLKKNPEKIGRLLCAIYERFD